MSALHPDVLISANAGELASTRNLVRDALLAAGCRPLLFDDLPADAPDPLAIVRQRVAACDAVVHVAGFTHGTAPAVPIPGHSQRSYAQLEYEIAAELRRPTYIYLLGTTFKVDPHEPEPAEKATLQRQHRTAIINSGRPYQLIGTAEDLEGRLRALRIARIRPSRTHAPNPAVKATRTIAARRQRYLLRDLAVGAACFLFALIVFAIVWKRAHPDVPNPVPGNHVPVILPAVATPAPPVPTPSTPKPTSPVAERARPGPAAKATPPPGTPRFFDLGTKVPP